MQDPVGVASWHRIADTSIDLLAQVYDSLLCFMPSAARRARQKLAKEKALALAAAPAASNASRISTNSGTQTPVTEWVVKSLIVQYWRQLDGLGLDTGAQPVQLIIAESVAGSLSGSAASIPQVLAERGEALKDDEEESDDGYDEYEADLYDKDIFFSDQSAQASDEGGMMEGHGAEYLENESCNNSEGDKFVAGTAVCVLETLD